MEIEEDSEEINVEISWRIEADNEFNEDIYYISVDDPKAAENLEKQVYHDIDLLETQPRYGKIPREIEYSGIDFILEIVVAPFRIFYEYHRGEDTLLIIRVSRGEKDTLSEYDIIGRIK